MSRASLAVLVVVSLITGVTISQAAIALGVSPLVYLPVCALAGLLLGWTHGRTGGWGMG